MGSEGYARQQTEDFLKDCGFVEFTSSLITETFEALIDADIKQMSAYVDLVRELSKDLSTYINDTKDDISLSELKDFVTNLNLPEPKDMDTLITALQGAYGVVHDNKPNTEVVNSFGSTNSTTPPSQVNPNTVSSIISALPSVAQSVASIFTKKTDNGSFAPVDFAATTVPSTESPISIYGNAITNAIPNYRVLYEAVAGKIANDKYSLLQNMVKMGLIRLVVTNGQIETRLTFQTSERQTSENYEYESHKNRTKTRTKSIFRDASRTRYKEKTKSLDVHVAKHTDTDTTGTQITIYGRVLINFKTDYYPLDQMR